MRGAAHVAPLPAHPPSSPLPILTPSLLPTLPHHPLPLFPPVQMVELLREPDNPYDRWAIRVDNVRGVKVGHLPRVLVCHVRAPLRSEEEGVLGGLGCWGQWGLRQAAAATSWQGAPIPLPTPSVHAALVCALCPPYLPACSWRR